MMVACFCEQRRPKSAFKWNFNCEWNGIVLESGGDEFGELRREICEALRLNQ